MITEFSGKSCAKVKSIIMVRSKFSSFWGEESPLRVGVSCIEVMKPVPGSLTAEDQFG